MFKKTEILPEYLIKYFKEAFQSNLVFDINSYDMINSYDKSSLKSEVNQSRFSHVDWYSRERFWTCRILNQRYMGLDGRKRNCFYYYQRWY